MICCYRWHHLLESPPLAGGRSVGYPHSLRSTAHSVRRSTARAPGGRPRTARSDRADRATPLAHGFAVRNRDAPFGRVSLPAPARLALSFRQGRTSTATAQQACPSPGRFDHDYCRGTRSRPLRGGQEACRGVLRSEATQGSRELAFATIVATGEVWGYDIAAAVPGVLRSERGLRRACSPGGLKGRTASAVRAFEDEGSPAVAVASERGAGLRRVRSCPVVTVPSNQKR